MNIACIAWACPGQGRDTHCRATSAEVFIVMGV